MLLLFMLALEKSYIAAMLFYNSIAAASTIYYFHSN